MKEARAGGAGGQQARRGISLEETIADEGAALLELLNRRPRTPIEGLAQAYGRLAIASLRQNRYLLTRQERDIADLVRFVDGGAINLRRNRERILHTARAATQDRQAFAAMTEFIERPAIRRALRLARRAEQQTQ